MATPRVPGFAPVPFGRRNPLRAHILLVLSLLCSSVFVVLTGQAQQNPPDVPSAQSAQMQGHDHPVEGTVVATSQHTVVVRSDDNQYHLFTYAAHMVPKDTVKPGARIRVHAGPPGSDGTQVVQSIDVIQPDTEATNRGPTQTQGSGNAIEGTVVSTSENTVVVRSDDNRYYLFTYAAQAVSQERVKPGIRVRVHGSTPNENGTQVIESIDVIQPGTETATGGAAAQTAQVNKLSKQIESEARRWHVGGKVGAGLSPELFMFGPQAQFGPFFSEHLLFRPNVEFGFGELTDMYAVNGEAAYRFSTKLHGQWAPYFGMGPAFNFISRSASNEDVSFSDFTYKTGFNIFVGAEKNKAFVEMKTSLWSGDAPVFRVFVGYNF
jgi:archaeosine-15-forming tRNA-guanine transglycosylase